MTDAVRRHVPRVLLALAVAGAVVAFYLFGPSEAEVLARQASWKAAVADNLFLALLIFFVVEVVLVGLSVPVATGLSVLAGLLFGRWLGTLVVSFASTLGAVLAMLAARYVVGDAVRRWVARRARRREALAALDRGVERDGWFYLLLIRLTPAFPFFLVNVGMGLTRIRLWTYAWATQLGMLPVTFVVVSAGTAVGEVTSFRELAGFERLWPLTALLVIPLGLRLLARRYLRRHPAGDTSGQNVT
jgi:uncharacterized membrane protein YdjX (TVP38/TMEM64 family)